MKLIIGLGNPGEKYVKTRHNFGFLALNHIQSKLDAFGDWTNDKNANALVCRGEISGEQIILAKPQTFMNLSGQTAAALAGFFKIPAGNIWVIHDDFDLPFGVLRISQNSSSAGHKGIKSIIEALGTKEFVRFRLGIHPAGQTFICKIFNKLSSIEKFVLKNFNKEEQKIVEEVIKKTSQAIETALKEGVEQAMNQFN